MLSSTYLPLLLLLLFATANLVVAYGDILNRTMCYCGEDGRNWDPGEYDPLEYHPGDPSDIRHRDAIPASDDKERTHEEVGIPSVPSAKNSKHKQASWIRFDYYSSHLDHTFTIEGECRSHWKLRKGTHDYYAYQSSRKNCLAYHQLHKKYCAKFNPVPNEIKLRKRKLKKHHFCYHFKPLFIQDTNGLKDEDYYVFDGRRRNVPKEGVIIQQLKDVVRSVCEPACKAKFDLPMMEGHWYHRSRVDTIWDQADMCRHCA